MSGTIINMITDATILSVIFLTINSIFSFFHELGHLFFALKNNIKIKKFTVAAFKNKKLHKLNITFKIKDTICTFSLLGSNSRVDMDYLECEKKIQLEVLRGGIIAEALLLFSIASSYFYFYDFSFYRLIGTGVVFNMEITIFVSIFILLFSMIYNFIYPLYYANDNRDGSLYRKLLNS